MHLPHRLHIWTHTTVVPGCVQCVKIRSSLVRISMTSLPAFIRLEIDCTQSLSFLVHSNWETGARESQSRAENGEEGHSSLAFAHLARSSLSITKRKERDCVQSRLEVASECCPYNNKKIYLVAWRYGFCFLVVKHNILLIPDCLYSRTYSYLRATV